jgi:hypothetical protein
MDPFVCSEKIHVVVKWKRVILNKIHGLQKLHFSFDLESVDINQIIK